MRVYSEQAYRTGTDVAYPRLHKWLGIFFVLLTGLSMAALMPQMAYAATNEVTLTIEQNLEKPTNSAPDDTFNYVLEAKAPGSPMPVGTPTPTTPVDLPIYTTIVSGTSSTDVGPITYTTTGTYVYEVRMEDTSAKTGYLFDTQVYTVTVYVTSGSTGLIAQYTIEKDTGEKTTGIVFNQSYNPEPTLQVDPPVKKQVLGDTPSTDATFTFKLEAADISNPMPEGSSNGVKYMDIIGAGERDFGTWNYTQAGTYHYTVSEVDRGDRGYAYDSEIYTITDTVTDVGGQLVNSRTVTNSAAKPADNFLFINTFTADPAAAVTGTTGPKTGDETFVGLYTFLLAAGSALAVACVAYLAGGRKAGRVGRAG